MVHLEVTGEVEDIQELLGMATVPLDVDDFAPASVAGESAGVIPFESAGLFDRLRPLKRLKRRVAEMVAERGGSVEEAEAAIQEIGDGRFLDWLMNGGLEKLVELILKILGIFA